METLYGLVKNGCSHKEIPIIFRERTEGKSKFSPQEILDFMRVALQLRCKKK